MRFRWLKALLSAVLLLWLGVCAAEIGLRLAEMRTGANPAAAAIDCYSADPVFTPLLTASWTAHHSLVPFAQHEMENPDTRQAVALVTNSFGLRGEEPVVPKPSDVYRIVCLGDENVLAPGVAEAETFCRRLQELLQARAQTRIEVLNAGVPGYCPLLSHLQFQHQLAPLNADLVILNFEMNDVADDHRVRRFLRADRNDRPLACPNPFLWESARGVECVGDAFCVVRWSQRQLAACTTSQRDPRDAGDIDTPEGTYAWLRDDAPDWSVYIRQTLEPIWHLQQAAAWSGAHFVLAASPAPWQTAETATAEGGVRQRFGVGMREVYRSRRPFELLAEFARGGKIAFCDVSPAIQSHEHPEQLFFDNAPRLSSAGHAVYARALAAFVVQHIAGPWTHGTYQYGDSSPLRPAGHSTIAAPRSFAPPQQHGR